MPDDTKKKFKITNEADLRKYSGKVLSHVKTYIYRKRQWLKAYEVFEQIIMATYGDKLQGKQEEKNIAKYQLILNYLCREEQSVFKFINQTYLTLVTEN